MDEKGVIEIVCRQLGLVYSTEKPKIDAAMIGALDEYGLYVSVPKAQNLTKPDIAANSNQIMAPTGFQRYISVIYLPTGSTKTYWLDWRRPEFLDQLSAEVSSTASDNIQYYTQSGQWLMIAPGLVKTGGKLQIRTQNRLTVADIPWLADTMLLVDAVEANLLDINSPVRENMRTSILNRYGKSIAKQDVPVQTKISTIKQDPVYLQDEAARLNIFRGGDF